MARTHLHRPHHPAGRARQDRHLPRRRGRRGQRLLADPRAARLRAVLRGPAGRGHAEPDRPDLRRLPRGAPHGRHEGPGRRVPRRSAAGGQEAPRAVLQHLLRDRPHDALLRPGRARLRRRARRAARPSGTSWASSRRSAWTSPARCSRCAATATHLIQMMGGRRVHPNWGLPGRRQPRHQRRAAHRRSKLAAREAVEFAKFSLQAVRRHGARE